MLDFPFVISRYVDALHISEPILLDQYVAISDYDKTDKNDLNLRAGNIVEVIHKADHGKLPCSLASREWYS